MVPSSIRSVLCRLTAAAALGAPLAVLPAAPATAAPPWWCAPDAVLSVATLPDALPASACALHGRSIVGRYGQGVLVPPVGKGAAATATTPNGADTVSAWTDEYAVHVRGDQYSAAFGYLDTMRRGAAPAADLARMALAVRRVAELSVGRVRPQPVPTATLLAAGDTLVAAYSGGRADDAATARETLAAHLGAVVAAPDGSAALDELEAMTRDVRVVLAAGTADGLTLERALTETAQLRTYLMDEVESTTDPAAVGGLLDGVTGLGNGLRAAIARGDGQTSQLAYTFDQTLADLSEYLTEQLAPLGLPGDVPSVSPEAPDPAGVTNDATTEAGSPPPCEDGDRRALFADKAHWPRGSSVRWYYSNTYRYGGYNGDVYASVAREAFDNITNLNDDCGYGWRPNIGNTYKGVAVHTLAGYSEGNCLKNDGTNVVGWRTIQEAEGDVLAIACVWRGATSVTGADIALGRQWHWDVPEYNGSFGYPVCGTHETEYDVEAVLTHEFGHVVALNDLPETGNAHLTMSALIAPCHRGARTPGRGDALGLSSLYTRR